MFYDIMIEQFKKTFKPTFKEVGIETHCYIDNELIVKKNEATGNFVFAKEYPQEIKDFVVNELKRILVNKYLWGILNTESMKVFVEEKEFEALIPNNNHLLTIMLYMKIKEIPGILVRTEDTYSFRPILEENRLGFTLEDKILEVYYILKELHPEVFRKS